VEAIELAVLWTIDVIKFAVSLASVLGDSIELDNLSTYVTAALAHKKLRTVSEGLDLDQAR